MTTNDGGPAFPIEPVSPGMSLRDYFAAKAMQAIIGHYGVLSYTANIPEGSSAEEIHFSNLNDENALDMNHSGEAKVAYEIADAMIAARQREPLQ